MVTIKGIEKGSPAARLHIKPGERLVCINGNEINDFLDYRFYNTETQLEILLEAPNGSRRTLNMKKGEYDDPGLEFDTFLMDRQRRCSNNCIFCFIDQLPPGLRDSLYFKDDDSRLSFLFGNYITLTNIDEHEIDRIIKMHISPVNISVHTVNPELRCKMMNNRFAGQRLQYIDRLAQAGVSLNCQLVLCPGINDGDELVRSLEYLGGLYPAVQSVAAVPVGLTGYREGLYPLTAYDRQSAGEVIDIIERYGNEQLRLHGDRLFYPADEFFNIARRSMPAEDYYGSMLQLENGVGMTALTRGEFMRTIPEYRDLAADGVRRTIATGEGAAPLIKELVDYAKKLWHNIDCEVVAIKNNFFGGGVNTTGLLTATDIIAQLQGRENLGELLLCSAMLRHERDIFLDDKSPADIEQALGVRVAITECGGDYLLSGLLGTERTF